MTATFPSLPSLSEPCHAPPRGRISILYSELGWGSITASIHQMWHHMISKRDHKGICFCQTLHWETHPWNSARQALSVGFPSQEYGMGCCFLFQGVFLTQGLNPHLLHLLHCQVYSLPLHHHKELNISIACLYISEHNGMYSIICSILFLKSRGSGQMMCIF